MHRKMTPTASHPTLIASHARTSTTKLSHPGAPADNCNGNAVHRHEQGDRYSEEGSRNSATAAPLSAHF